MNLTQGSKPDVRKHAPPTPPPPRQYSVLEVAAALIVAVGAMLVARAVFDVANVFVLAVIVYAVFVAVVAAIEYVSVAAEPRPVKVDIDLVAGVSAADLAEVPSLRTVPEAVEPPDEPVRRRSVSAADTVEIGVAAVAAAGFAEIVRLLLRMQSLVGLSIWWYVAFIAIYFVLVRDRDDAEAATEQRRHDVGVVGGAARRLRARLDDGDRRLQGRRPSSRGTSSPTT